MAIVVISRMKRVTNGAIFRQGWKGRREGQGDYEDEDKTRGDVAVAVAVARHGRSQMIIKAHQVQ